MIKLAAISTIISSILTLAQVNPSDVKSTTIENPEYTIEEVTPVTQEVKPVIKTATVEEIVKNYFKDTPILVKVAKCESQFRQYGKDGTVLRGIQNTGDVGVMQINEHYHLERSKNLGIDIYDIYGNMEYGLKLYQEKGTGPWLASSPCWAKM